LLIGSSSQSIIIFFSLRLSLDAQMALLNVLLLTRVEGSFGFIACPFSIRVVY